MKTGWLAAGGAALLATMYFWTGTAPKPAEPPAEWAELARQMRRLEHKVAAQGQVSPAPAPAPRVVQAPAPPAEPSAPEPIEPAAAPAPAPAQIIPLETRVETTFASEDRDPEWAEHAADTIAQGWTPLLPAGSQVTDIDCRQSLCRVELSHRQVDDHRAAALSAIQNGVWPGPGTFNLVEVDGTIQTVAYLGRPGLASELWQD